MGDDGDEGTERLLNGAGHGVEAVEIGLEGNGSSVNRFSFRFCSLGCSSGSVTYSSSADV